ncbi:phage baseplate assembly protein V [Kaustia mangrovi]|uniref:Phage baseplate assembly protein V n=1 Tax=Kaustia mangrovi TaxID=2593653 RepID=A0A7S8HCV1_9HYPH|nr:phage baseplate assembly protein V [Kaustia mangrovi]QPC44011.1 phage baseplate assembly protein V [Kaustia mangrovi]
MASSSSSNLSRVLAPIRRRIDNMVSRGVWRRGDDGKKMQEGQVSLLKNEVRDRVERWQNYGITSVPHEGAETVVMFVGGSRDHPMIMAVDDRRYRKKDMEAGEVALYTDEGDYVHIKRGRIVEIKAGSLLKIDAPEVTITGNLKVEGDIGIIVENGDVEAKVRLNTHEHTDVVTGSDLTGPPKEDT